MEITEVRIFLKDSPDKKLKAYATVTFDNAFVVRNIKVIESQGNLFIAMPARRIKYACPKCGGKNESRAKYCSFCGVALAQPLIPTNKLGTQMEHKDIAHPITQSFREYLQKRVLEAYEKEKAMRSQRPSSS